VHGFLPAPVPVNKTAVEAKQPALLSIAELVADSASNGQ
jgi:hypothetical protein